MLSHGARRVALLSSCLAAFGGGALLTTPSAHAAACSGNSGVTVVIESAAGNSTRCAPGNPSNSNQALRAVASVIEVQTQPGFVCRIDGYPKSRCVNTPPASAYWSFWHAKPGGTWVYSQVGVNGWDPAPGSSIAFRFGSGQRPSTKPASASAPPRTSKPRPTTAPPRPRDTASKPRTTSPDRRSSDASTTPGTRPSAPTRPTQTSAASPSPSVSTSRRPSTSPSPSATPSASASPSPSASPTDAQAAAEQAQPGDGPDGTARLVGGSALLAGLAAAIGAVALRRRRGL